jgi:pullulanase
LTSLGLLLIALVVTTNPVTGQEGTTCEQVTLHYHRSNTDESSWGLHVWGPTSESVTWESPLQPAGEDDCSLYWLVDVNAGVTLLIYGIHKGDQKDPGPDQSLSFAENGCEIWLLQGRGTQFSDPTTVL